MIAVPRPAAARAFAWIVLAGLAVFALSRVLQPSLAPRPVQPSRAAPMDYASAISLIDRKLAGLRQLAAVRDADWLMQERIAYQLIARARLTGSFEDYAAAQAALDRGFASATPGAGPHMTQAALALSLHRLGKAEQMLAAVARYAVPPEAEVRAGARGMAGDILFYRGRYREALAAYRSVSRDGDRPDYRLAIFYAKMGRPADAASILDRIASGSQLPGQALANLLLQRGTIALQQGDWPAAQDAFTRAQSAFPGWWLSDAYGAQMLALDGRYDEAIAAFEAIARRSEDPELRDALASLYRAKGDYTASTRWASEAAQGWTARLKLIPEAAWGHAVEHELAFGSPARALDLARRDFAQRPHGATAIALAWALLTNNRPADALKLIERVNASGWQSAEQHLVAARAHALLGHSADAEQDQALAINPKALDPNAALLWFGH